MPLRVELKPFERIMIGETVLVNSGTRTSFLIDGDAPILREKDTVTAETANTPAKRLYLCIQIMYLKNDIPRYRTSYLLLHQDLREDLPGYRAMIDAINNHVLRRALYKALKEIRKLMKREDMMMECLKRRPPHSPRENSQGQPGASISPSSFQRPSQGRAAFARADPVYDVQSEMTFPRIVISLDHLCLGMIFSEKPVSTFPRSCSGTR